MNSGQVTKRYATALLRFTLETGSAPRVCEQVRAMLRNPSVMPSPLEEDLRKFFSLVVSNGRKAWLRRILMTYVDFYCEAAGLAHVLLTSAVPSKELEDRVRREIEKSTGKSVVLESKVDPSLIGGYRVEVDGMMLDASVRRQFEILQRQFIEKNNRIV